jgi:WD40 repeat protein
VAIGGCQVIPLRDRAVFVLEVAVALSLAATQPATAAQVPPAQARTDLYGDPLPPGALVRMGTVQMRHGVNLVMPLVFSRDGKTILSASGVDRKIRAWDVKTRREAFTRALAPISNEFWPEFAFSADGARVAARLDHQRLVAWNVADGKQLREVEAPLSFAKQIALSSDGRLLAAGHSNFSIMVWDIATGKKREFRAGDAQLAHDVFFSPDDKRVAMVSHDALHIFDVASGKHVRKIPNKMSLVSTQLAAFAPDGKTVAAWMTGDDSHVAFWDIDSGKELWRISGPGSPLVFSRDGSVLATGSDGAIQLWDVAKKKELGAIEKSGRALAFAPDGRTLAFRHGAAIMLFDVPTGKLFAHDRGHIGPVGCIAFSADGRTLASALHASDVRLWDTATGKELRRFVGKGGALNVLALTPQALVAGSSDGTVLRWHPASGKELPSIQVPGDRRGLVLYRSSDGTMLIATTHFAEDDKKYPLYGWDLKSGEELFRRRDAEKPLFPSFVSRAGKPSAHEGFASVAASPVQDRLQLSYPIAFSPDGKIVAVARRAHDPDPGGLVFANPVKAISLYDAATAKLLRRIEAGPLGALCFSPDGRYLVAAAPDRLRLWEVVSGLEVFQRPAHERFASDNPYRGSGEDSFASSLAFAPDCRRVATGLVDSTILIWDMTPPAAARAAALDAKSLEALWGDLASAEGRKVHAAVLTLVGAGDAGVAALKSRVPPTPPLDAKRLRGLLADLGSERFNVRDTAMRELRALGEEIEPYLDEARKEKRSLEFQSRADTLRDAMRVVHSPETLRRLRAVQALEYIATPAARQLLAELAKGAAGSRVTQDARKALQRLAP